MAKLAEAVLSLEVSHCNFMETSLSSLRAGDVKLRNVLSKDSFLNGALNDTEGQYHDGLNPPTGLPSPQRLSLLQRRMQSCLDRLGIPLRVAWLPDSNSAKHGEIRSGCLVIYDQTEEDAWKTLEHEVYEWKFSEVTCIYRTVINSLLDSVEKLTYRNKEAFIESLPRVSEVIGKEKRQPDPPAQLQPENEHKIKK